MYSVLYLFSNLEYRKSLEAKDKSIHKVVSIRKKACTLGPNMSEILDTNLPSSMICFLIIA